jgi:hypothetical protein
MDNEIIDISSLNENLDDTWDFSFKKNKNSTNFGGGIELLMNDKKKDTSKSSGDIDIDDLNILENELNDLADVNISSNKNMYEPRSDLFNKNLGYDDSADDRHSVKFDDNINIGHATAENGNNESKTWDGYSKFNNIPINPDKQMPQQPQMNKEELLREKFKYLRRLETLETKGITLTKKYSMESPLAEMQGEYEMIMEEKSKKNSIKFQGNMLMAFINGIEFLNNRFDPFDIKLDGWGDQINENLEDYDDVFGELHEKYKSKASLAPELKLLFQLGGSAMMVHMTNTMFKSSMPGMDDILRQNPDLMKQFQTAAVNSMGQTNPGFSGFMNGIMNPEAQTSSLNMSGPPPPPMSTQYQDPISNRNGNNNSSSKGRPFYSPNVDDGINIRENYSNPYESEKSMRSSSSSTRPEMKGPSDISDILSGLKTKTINIQETTPQNNDSYISITELKELQSEGNMPKRSKRRQKSDKNTLSLDI